MQEIRIVLAQIGPLLLTILGAISWTGASGSRRLAVALWAAALVSAGVVAGVEIKKYYHEGDGTPRGGERGARATPLFDPALEPGGALEDKGPGHKDPREPCG